jgi:hypothetical protein
MRLLLARLLRFFFALQEMAGPRCPVLDVICTARKTADLDRSVPGSVVERSAVYLKVRFATDTAAFAYAFFPARSAN